MIKCRATSSFDWWASLLFDLTRRSVGLEFLEKPTDYLVLKKIHGEARDKNELDFCTAWRASLI
jgi:hypothetical protein